MTDYQKYKNLLSKIADVQNAANVLNWDQETYMPTKGAHFRAQQLATLSGIAHELSTSNELGDLLNKLSFDTLLQEKEKRNIKESLKKYNENKKYSTAFVQLLSNTISQTFQAWKKAKTENNFSIYAPHLEKLIKLKQEECELLGYKAHPYDALLNQYEPGATTTDLELLFANVRSQLVPFIKQIAAKPQLKDGFMFKHYDDEKQWNFGIILLKQMGYDFEAGRQDKSLHPFTTNFSAEDVRVTTRINEQDLNEMIWSCIHEGGHALYEQGLPAEEYGLPSSEYISLGVHESQSRLWENNVGRSLPYWKNNYAKLQHLFPENLKEVRVEDFYKAMNVVKPSLIRTAADELTYHTHILIRFEIEKALIEGSLAVNELPRFWNDKYKTYLGVTVPNDDQGVLQDIHWSHGSVGYFPTYSIGSFYAAQFYTQAKKEMEQLESEIEKGNMQLMLNWLRAKIHIYGKYYTAEELCIAVTGEKLNFKYFMEYAKTKYTPLYNL
jgi:carboxypeptidase Taq